MPMTSNPTLSAIRDAAFTLSGAADDYDPLLDLVGDARFVLLGEASHGTHEFYRARAEITRRLIEERGFTAVAVEADWPDAYRVNRFVRGMSEDVTANEALGDFLRFPTWMWRNADVLDFIGWLREHNSQLGDARATERGTPGELNVGQLVRERFGRDAILVGFTTYAGTVTAANDWDAPADRKQVRPALPGSYEELFHETDMSAFLLPMRDSEVAANHLRDPRLERAIGVI